MGVVEVAVGTGFFQFSAFVQAPVSFNVIMIANVFEMTVVYMVFFAVMALANDVMAVSNA